jgi:HK97 family phage major capsid protein
MNRAWSVIEFKAIDEEKRIIEGIASTPRTDRMEDIVEPMGAVIDLPVPFKWQHGKDAFVGDTAVGNVVWAKPNAKGIPVRIQIERDDEPGHLKDILDFVWKSIKKRLVRGLSIGFNDLESESIKGSFGVHFLKWEMLELSAVTIPANADATITTIKQFDEQSRAATGRRLVRFKSPGDSGSTKAIKPGAKMTITERIGAYEAKRAAHVARMEEITKKAGDDGNRSKDESEKEEFDTLRDEIKTIDEELVDLKDMERLNIEKAKPVDPAPNGKAGSESRGREVRVALEEKLEPGIEFARYAMCLLGANFDVPQALALAQAHYPKQERAIRVLKAAASVGQRQNRLITGMMEMKAAVAAGTTTDATWALPLVEYNQFAGDFVEFLRARTIIGRFGRDGIPDVRRIPFNVHIRGQTVGGTGYWVGQGKAKPVTKFGYNDTYHGFAKVAVLTALAEELIRFSNPSAEALVRDSLAEVLIERMDTDFVDPAVAAVANVSPASITNAVVAIGSTGNDGDAVRADIAALWATALAANLPTTGAVYLMPPGLAMATGLMTNALGQPEFPGLNMNGGTLGGVPVITSNYVPAATVILVFASEIWLSDDGVVTIDSSRDASIEMASDPSHDSSTPTETTVVSMYQTDSVALRAHRYINWSKRRTQAVAVLNSVTWGVPAAS